MPDNKPILSINVTLPLTKEAVDGLHSALLRDMEEINRRLAPPPAPPAPPKPQGALTVEKVKEIIWEFARSQGFYGRLGRDLDDSNGWEKLTEAANKAGCTSSLDLILFIEG